MKKIVFTLGLGLLLGACATAGAPWDRPTVARTAEQAPSSIIDRQGAAQQDARMAHYRGMNGQVIAGQGIAGQAEFDGGRMVPPATGAYDPYRTGQNYAGQNHMDQNQAAMAPFPAPAAGLPPVKVALLVPLSGPQAELGQAMQNAAQLALFDMGYDTFELMPRDTANSAEAARQAAMSAINDGAQLILGPVFADAVRAVKPVAAARGVNVVSFSTDWTVAGGNSFMMGFLPFGQVQRIAEHIAQKNIQRVGILAPDNAYGNAVVGAYQSAARQLGLPQATVARFPAQQANLNDVVKNFARYDQRKGADGAPAAPAPYDAILLPVGGERASALAGLLRFYEMGPENVQLLGTGLWDDPALARDPAMRGALFAAPQPDLRANFERNYRNTYGGMAPPRLATLAYDATALAVVLARNGVQTTGRPQFDRNAITNPNGFAGIDGIFRFRPDGLVERGQAVLTFRDMTIHMVERAPRTFQAAPQPQAQNVNMRGGM